MEPLTVSIITPCYNGARYLRDTLQSAMAQTRPPLEVLVIDDGSTDDSAAIAERLGGPVRVLRQTNQGESVARNRGLSEALGTHVLFLDADDLLDPRALEHLIAALDGRPHAIALMGCALFSQGDPSAPHTTKLFHFSKFYPDIIQSNFAPPLCWLAPIDAVRRAGGFCETLRWFEDWDLWWRVGLDEPELVCVPFVGAKYRQHAASQLATTKPEDRAGGHVALIDRMATAFLDRPALLAAHGDSLFWSMWTALARAREAGVDWKELRSLSNHLRQMAIRNRGDLRRSLTGRAVRLFGARVAVGLRSWAGNSPRTTQP